LNDIDRSTVIIGAGGMLLKINKNYSSFCHLIDSNKDGLEGGYLEDAEICFSLSQ